MKNIAHVVRDRVSIFLIAILIPILVEYGTKIFAPHITGIAKVSDQAFFISYLIFGFLALAFGMFVRVPALGVGAMFGGTLCIVAGYWENWRNLSNEVIFISVLLALILLGYALYHYSKK